MESVNGPLCEGVFSVVPEEVERIEVSFNEILDENSLFFGKSKSLHDVRGHEGPDIFVVIEVVVSFFICRVCVSFSNVVEESGKGDDVFFKHIKLG